MRILTAGFLCLLLAPAATACTSAYAQASPDGIYFTDDFSNPASGWDRVSGSDGLTDYSGGMYRIFSATPDYYLWATSGRRYPPDVVVEVDAVKKTGLDASVFGILCRYRDTGNFYILMITAEGQAGIARMLGGKGPELLTGATLKSAPSIQTGPSVNHLTARCVGSSISLEVNGSLAASAEDSALADGDAGLWLGTYDLPGTDVYFDNFVVRKP